MSKEVLLVTCILLSRHQVLHEYCFILRAL